MVTGMVGGAGRVTGTVFTATVSAEAVDLLGATLKFKKGMNFMETAIAIP